MIGLLLFIFVVLIISILILLSLKVLKKAFNPVLLINFVYLAWFILGRIKFLGQFVPTYDSSIFIGLNIIIVDLEIFFGYLINIESKKSRNQFKKIKLEKLLNVVRIICFIISIFVFLNLLIGLINGKFLITKIRDISYSVRYNDDAYTQIYFNSVIYYFYQYVVRGFAFFDLTYNMGKLIYGKEKKISIISIINFILFILIMQSRIEFMKFVIFMIIFLVYSKIKINSKQKKILKRSVMVLTIAILITFSVRSIKSNTGVVSNTINSFIVDFSGSNYTFSTFFEEYKKGLIISDSPIVLKYLGGIGLLLEHALKIFGFEFNHIYINDYLTIGHNIGSSDHYNAFYTLYFDFLNSGGYIGCFLFSLFFGIIIGYTFKKNYKYSSLKNNYIAAFITYVMIMGTYYYVLSGIYALVIIFCILLVDNEINIKTEDNTVNSNLILK